MSENSRLKPKQHRVIVLLLSGHTFESAAQLAKVNSRSIRRWLLDDQAFVDALRNAESAAVDDAVRRLVGMQNAALDIQLELMERAKSEHVKQRASQFVMEHALKLRELLQLGERVAALEEKGRMKL